MSARKIIYILAIIALLVPLSYLSQPATRKTETGDQSQGGKLAQLRADYDLGQSNLGDIDPTSEAMKLATLGMRGIAADILWEKANEYKKKEDWTNLSATVEQIKALQPNFVSVWRFQAWNLSYNVAVEFDDYKDRYYWIIKGINFLKEGTTYNRKEPRLMWDLGWFIGQKIGRADEHVLYRKLFKDDDDFHAADNPNRRRADRDNWLVGREKFQAAQDMVDRDGVFLRGINPVVFHSDPAMSLINYADTLEDEGTFGDVAKTAWIRAGESWKAYGARDVPTPYDIPVHLADQEMFEARSKEAQAKLDALAPGLRELIRKERIAKLKKEEQESLAAPADKRTSAQALLIPNIEEKLVVTYTEIADRVEGKNRAAALEAAEDAAQNDFKVRAISQQRGVVNYDFWKLRCEFESTDNALTARKQLYEAEKKHRASDLLAAEKLYEDGFNHWAEVFKEYPALLTESIIIDDLGEAIDKYRRLLGEIDKPFPKDFVLRKIDEQADQRRTTPVAAKQESLVPEVKIPGLIPAKQEDKTVQPPLRQVEEKKK